MKYPIAEKFKSPQGEGIYTGTMMAFIRLVGCSVGKTICTACDTDFEKMDSHLGGGSFSPEQLLEWVGEYEHVCITGGEPLDRDLDALFHVFEKRTSASRLHVETSGTKPIPSWLQFGSEGGDTWLTICPKPGYMPENISYADEVKVIVNGLGDGKGWPTLEDAVRWADSGIPTFLQPRNDKHTIDWHAMEEAKELVALHPQLRLSLQTHKLLHVR